MAAEAPESVAPREWPGGDDPTLTIEDRIKLDVYLKWRAEGFRQIKGGTFRDRMMLSLSIDRKYAPRVFRHICRTDLEAASIAVQRGWIDDTDHRHGRTDEDRAHASAVVAEAVAHLRTKDRRDGKHVGIGEAVASVTAAWAALSPEQLEAARAADPEIKKARAYQEQQRRETPWRPA